MDGSRALLSHMASFRTSILSEWLDAVTVRKAENLNFGFYLCAQLLQSCLTLCDPMDCSPPGSSVHGISGKYNGVDCHFLLQGIFSTQGLNPRLLCLLCCRQILYRLSNWGNPQELPTIWKPRISDLRTMLATQRLPALHAFVLLWIRRGF